MFACPKNLRDEVGRVIKLKGLYSGNPKIEYQDIGYDVREWHTVQIYDKLFQVLDYTN